MMYSERWKENDGDRDSGCRKSKKFSKVQNLPPPSRQAQVRRRRVEYGVRQSKIVNQTVVNRVVGVGSVVGIVKSRRRAGRRKVEIPRD